MEIIEKTFTFICILFAIGISALAVYTIFAILCNIWGDNTLHNPEEDEDD